MTEPDVSDLMTVSEAARVLDAVDVQPRQELVELAEAVGRRLAEDVVADRHFPPFDKALMDGWAVRVGEPAGEFEVVGEVHAGSAWKGPPLRGRQIVAIMTGAPVPPGKDGAIGIVPVEQSRRTGEGAVHLDTPAEPSRFISRRGSDSRAGQALLNAGVLLGPQHIGVLASVGKSQVRVVARPRCVVLTTGDEIVPVEESPGAHQIRNSNGPALAAMLRHMGCEVVEAGHVPDELEELRRVAMQWLSSSCDCLLMTGGMSMGERDYVPRVLEDLGVEIRVRKLKIKPGKPFVFGTRWRESGFVAGDGGAAERGRRGTYVFGLPGNPVSAAVCTRLLAARLLARLGGGEGADIDRQFQDLPLAASVEANGPRQFYQPARVSAGRVEPLAWKGSADLFTFAAADGLIERPPNDPARPAGEQVRFLPLQ